MARVKLTNEQYEEELRKLNEEIKTVQTELTEVLTSNDEITKQINMKV
jgi:septal ring factor EnvC (AmiA/AmiB activator)